jgi:glutathione S-transferase
MGCLKNIACPVGMPLKHLIPAGFLESKPYRHVPTITASYFDKAHSKRTIIGKVLHYILLVPQYPQIRSLAWQIMSTANTSVETVGTTRRRARSTMQGSTAEGIQGVMRELLENGEMPYKDYCSI